LQIIFSFRISDVILVSHRVIAKIFSPVLSQNRLANRTVPKKATRWGLCAKTSVKAEQHLTVQLFL
jgi:hypothetical protein